MQWVCRDGIASGGKDGLVKVWSLALKPLVEFDMRTQVSLLSVTHRYVPLPTLRRGVW